MDSEKDTKGGYNGTGNRARAYHAPQVWKARLSRKIAMDQHTVLPISKAAMNIT